MSIDDRKPRSELRDWSIYATVTEWFDDYRGYVPTQMAHGIDRLIRETGLSFPDAYRQLLGRGAIIHLDPADDIESEDAGANSESPMDSRDVLIVDPLLPPEIPGRLYRVQIRPDRSLTVRASDQVRATFAALEWARVSGEFLFINSMRESVIEIDPVPPDLEDPYPGASLVHPRAFLRPRGDR